MGSIILLNELYFIIINNHYRRQFSTIAGPTLLPKLFQLLRKCIGSIVFKRPAAPCSSTKFPIAGGNENHPSGSYHSEPESLMLVEKLLDVLETSCPSSDTSLVVTDNQNETSKPISCADSEEYFQIFRQYMKEIIEACMELLSLSQSVETLRMAPVHVKVLSEYFKTYILVLILNTWQ